MSVRLSHHAYGKHHVQLSKIRRDPNTPGRHTLVEADVSVMLEGNMDAAYTEGDNSLVVATDTCKNTVYVLAQDDPFETIESFGITVAQHFLRQYSHVSRVTVSLREKVWTRLLDCPHAFTGNESSCPTATVIASRDQPLRIRGGIDDLVIAKTTESGFENFHRDEFRTLPDTHDRILATSVKAEWDYCGDAPSFSEARETILAVMLHRFIDHYSRSVQQTLMLMGQAAIEACAAIDSITLVMPNKHHILFNLAPFGRENHNDVFVVTDNPSGYITATIDRV